MLGLWNYSKAEKPYPYGDEQTYRKAMEFLSDCEAVEDWGCGTAFAKKFAKGRYIGIDGSPSQFTDVVADLREYTSQVDGILMRHVLEHNNDWKKVLYNAVKSFKKKLAIIIFTPFGDKIKVLQTNWNGTPDISFRRDDLQEFLKELWTREESLRSGTQYAYETIIYVTRP